MKTSLSDKLKDLRISHGYNQEYVASYLDVVRQTYSNYETGIRYPNTSILYKLAELYEITLDDIVKDTFPSSSLKDTEASYNTEAGSTEDIDEYITYMKDPKNLKKFSLLTNKERDLVYFYNKLSENDQIDFLDFFKIKAKRNKGRK